MGRLFLEPEYTGGIKYLRLNEKLSAYLFVSGTYQNLNRTTAKHPSRLSHTSAETRTDRLGKAVLDSRRKRISSSHIQLVFRNTLRRTRARV